MDEDIICKYMSTHKFNNQNKFIYVGKDAGIQLLLNGKNIENINPEKWIIELKANKPNFLFICSDSLEMSSIFHFFKEEINRDNFFDYCSQNEIKLIFWIVGVKDSNLCIEIAKKSNYILIENLNLISKYKGIIENQKIYFFPKGADILRYNPIGSVFTNKLYIDFTYPNISKEKINKYFYEYDISKTTSPEKRKFNKKYQFFLLNLPVEEKENIISQTVLNLIASNSIPMMNYSRIHSVLLGKSIISSDDINEILSRTKKYLCDLNILKAHCSNSLRKIVKEHTSIDRINYLFEILNLQPFFILPDIVVISKIKNESEKTKILSILDQQSYPIAKIIFIADNYEFKKDKNVNIVIHNSEEQVWNEIDNCLENTYFAFINYNDYYGKFYLEDLVLATKYSNALIIGKKIDYSQINKSTTNFKNSYIYTYKVNPYSSIICKSILTKSTLHKILKNNILISSVKCLLIDELSYIKDYYTADNWKNSKKNNDEYIENYGSNFYEIIDQCDSIKPIVIDTVKEMFLDAIYILNKVKSIKDIEIKIDDNILIIKSGLIDRFAYLYDECFYTLQEIGIKNNDIIFFEAYNSLNIVFVIVFYDIKKEKIGHSFFYSCESKPIEVPESCQYIKYGFKITNSGEAHIHNISSKRKFFLTGNRLAKLISSFDNVDIEQSDNRCLCKWNLYDKYSYIYFKKTYEREEINIKNFDLLTLACEGKGLFNFVIVFFDNNMKKLSHVFLYKNDPKNIYIPNNTKYLKLGFRLEGNGEFCFKSIYTIRNKKEDVCLLQNSSIIISQSYPKYDNIYNYYFVHQRLIAYERKNLCVDVYEMSQNNSVLFREFEGINIINGNEKYLQSILSSEKITTICIHALKKNIWNVVKKFIGIKKIIIWCHGIEVQHWKRRQYEFRILKDEDINNIKKWSNERELLWKDVFNYIEYVEFVFVSKFLQKTAFEDFHFPEKTKFSIIHNFIDENKFIYTKKSIEDRLKILSIRPYSSLTYANDLTVKTILELKDKNYFNKLKFTLWGDGKFFDDIVKPLWKFENISIHKCFLNHDEIVREHKKNGVFLVPTRSDTQGVSRDEAMSSGLVAVTNNVAAIPEFTDKQCAMVVEPESYKSLANAIEYLYYNPEEFLKLSNNASKRTREQVGFENTIAKEIRLINSFRNKFKDDNFNKVKYIVYSDTNPNVFDGSSLWLTSVLSILSKNNIVLVLLKCDIKNEKNVLSEIQTKQNIFILQPKDFPIKSPFSINIVVDLLLKIEKMCKNLIGLLIRGYYIANKIVQSGGYKNKLMTYLSAFYTPEHGHPSDIPNNLHALVRRLLTYSKKIFIQTSFLAFQYEKFLGHPFNWSLLPPAIPDNTLSLIYNIKQNNDVINIGYGGKLYPLWGVEELIIWSQNAIKNGLKICVHLAISKIYNNNEYRSKIDPLLKQNHIKIYKNFNRIDTMSLMKSMNFAWCWRNPIFETKTLELSMKMLESASINTPCICYPSIVNVSFFGDNYPYYAKTYDDFINILSSNNICKDFPYQKIVSKYRYSNIKIDI